MGRCGSSKPIRLAKRKSAESFDSALFVVHLQGLEPWAHWLRELQIHFSSMANYVEYFIICLFIVVLWSFRLCVLRIVCTMRIHYPGVPMCKKCAKMCSAFWCWKKLEFSCFCEHRILCTFHRVQFHFLHDSKLHHPHRFSGRVWDKQNGRHHAQLARQTSICLHLFTNQQMPYCGDFKRLYWICKPVPRFFISSFLTEIAALWSLVAILSAWAPFFRPTIVKHYRITRFDIYPIFFKGCAVFDWWSSCDCLSQKAEQHKNSLTAAFEAP